MDMLCDRLGFPKSHYRRHQAVLAGLQSSFIADLAQELGLPPAQVEKWIGASAHQEMSIQASEVFCRLIDTLDGLLELYSGNVEDALHWLTSPHMALANELPVNLLVTESGGRVVQQAIRAIEFGLPV